MRWCCSPTVGSPVTSTNRPPRRSSTGSRAWGPAVLRIALAELRAHARRVVGTLFAVVFGVAFVAGTFIFTDTARAGFFDAFARTGLNVDVDAQPHIASKQAPARLSPDQLATVRGLSDVAAAEGRVAAPLAMLD